MPNEIRARNFIPEDADGKSGAAIEVTEDGPRLILYNDNGSISSQNVA